SHGYLKFFKVSASQVWLDKALSSLSFIVVIMTSPGCFRSNQASCCTAMVNNITYERQFGWSQRLNTTGPYRMRMACITPAYTPRGLVGWLIFASFSTAKEVAAPEESACEIYWRGELYKPDAMRRVSPCPTDRKKVSLIVSAQQEKELLERVPTRLHINGEWVEASSGKTLPVYDPAHGKELLRIRDGNRDVALKALTAA